MKFFLAAASTAFVAVLPSVVTANPFTITAPTTIATGFDVTAGGSNDLGTFTFGLAGYDASSFTASYSACASPEGSITFPADSLTGVVTLNNPTTSFTEETWCVKVELLIPATGFSPATNTAGNILAAIEYTVTVAVQDDGSFTVDDSHTALQLPDTASFTDADGLGEIAYDPFAIGTYLPSAEVDPSPIVLGVTDTAQVSVFLGGAEAIGYSCTVASASVMGVPGVTGTAGGGSGQCGFLITGITDPTVWPASIWANQNSIIVTLSVDWVLSRRLQDGTIQQEVASSGTVEIEVDARLFMEKEELSTGAIAGIAAAAGIIFFLVVFTMWRQGCFEDKRAAAAAKPPKTVCVDEENSATTGSDVQA